MLPFLQSQGSTSPYAISSHHRRLQVQASGGSTPVRLLGHFLFVGKCTACLRQPNCTRPCATKVQPSSSHEKEWLLGGCLMVIPRQLEQEESGQGRRKHGG